MIINLSLEQFYSWIWRVGLRKILTDSNANIAQVLMHHIIRVESLYNTFQRRSGLLLFIMRVVEVQCYSKNWIVNKMKNKQEHLLSYYILFQSISTVSSLVYKKLTCVYFTKWIMLLIMSRMGLLFKTILHSWPSSMQL